MICPSGSTFANGVNWSVVGSHADYDANGHSDLLLRNADSGALSLWLINTLQIIQAQSFAAGTAWSVLG